MTPDAAEMRHPEPCSLSQCPLTDAPDLLPSSGEGQDGGTRGPLHAFISDCVRRIADGIELGRDDAALFSAYLAARENAGHSLLGPYAGPDPSFDTVTGRCGIGPK